jgi:hypothetical protein
MFHTNSLIVTWIDLCTQCTYMYGYTYKYGYMCIDVYIHMNMNVFILTDMYFYLLNSDMIGFVYPMYASIKAIKSKDTCIYI